jgi:Double zinc ribbon
VADLTTLILPLLIIVILVAVALAVMLYAIRRLKARRAQLLSQLQDVPDLVEDRAFNRLRMASSEADILERQGTDVSRPRMLLQSAQEAFNRHNYPSALSSAQSAHEALVSLRQGTAPATSRFPGNAPGSNPQRSGETIFAPNSPAPVAAPAVSMPSASRLGFAASGSEVSRAPPRNQAESRFEISVLSDEIAEARQKSRKDSAVAESESLRLQASRAYERADYTEALRFALRGRRRIGGHLETLSSSVGASPTRSGFLTNAPGSEVDFAVRAADSARCPQCGAPIIVADKFCRGCGTPQVARSCPRCQQRAQPGDTFCGNCGTALP